MLIAINNWNVYSVHNVHFVLCRPKYPTEEVDQAEIIEDNESATADEQDLEEVMTSVSYGISITYAVISRDITKGCDGVQK